MKTINKEQMVQIEGGINLKFVDGLCTGIALGGWLFPGIGELAIGACIGWEIGRALSA